MLELPILAIFAICIFGMMTRKRKREAALPIWERENRKKETETWLTGFLKKLKRNSTRTQKCRLISSVERMNFEEDHCAADWQFVRFGEEEAEIFMEDNYSLEKIKVTVFQKMILKSDPSLKNQLHCRSKIKQETGKWDIPADLQNRKIFSGGEALIFSEIFGDLETAVRVHIFDPFLFTNDFGFDLLTSKIHFQKDFEAVDEDKSGKQNEVLNHENVIANFVNIELFHKEDSENEDCLGWITIMEKGEEDLRNILKEEKIGIDERKKIAEGIENGIVYLKKSGISHFDLKMENILMVGGIPKIIDFGLVEEQSGRNGYREMGYTRKGSKFRFAPALFAATPGFADQRQFTMGESYKVQNLFYFLFCDWKTGWTILYAPIDENERKIIDEIIKKCNASSIHEIKERKIRRIISEISSIISIPSSSSLLCLDDPNLTKSVNVSNLKQNATKCLNQNLQNVTKNVLDQKISNLCVPISVATLLRFAMKNDLDFEDKLGLYSTEAILANVTLIIFPRSMAGLNLNPNEEETQFQTTEVEMLLERICKKTYLMETGWQIIREISYDKEDRPRKSTCKFEKFILNENFRFTRPLTVTGAYLLPDRVTILFHQMVLDRIENETDYNNAEYIIHNTLFGHGGPVLKIPKTRAYYVNESMMLNNQTGPNEFKFYGPEPCDFMWLVNERFGNMQPETWYLLPQAYSITLVPEQDSPNSSDSEP